MEVEKTDKDSGLKKQRLLMDLTFPKFQKELELGSRNVDEMEDQPKSSSEMVENVPVNSLQSMIKKRENDERLFMLQSMDPPFNPVVTNQLYRFTIKKGNMSVPVIDKKYERPNYSFYGSCYHCSCADHSQNFCPLRYCRRCYRYGHSDKVCHF